MNIGIIGTGNITRNAHLPVLTTMPDASVAWVTDHDETIGRQVARSWRLPFAPLSDIIGLPHCDLALLAIPVEARPRYLQVFADRGTAVLVEKPFALTVADHEVYSSKFPAHAIACSLQRRLYATTMLMADVARSCCFGRLRRIIASEGARTTRTGVGSGFLNSHHRSSGVTADLGAHALDLAIFVTGAQNYEILKTSTVMDGTVDRRLAGTMRLETPTTNVEFEFCFSWLDAQSNTIIWQFDHAEIHTNTAPSENAELRADGRLIASIEAPRAGARTIAQAFYLEWQRVIRAVETGRPSELAATNVKMTTRVLSALLDCVKSA